MLSRCYLGSLKSPRNSTPNNLLSRCIGNRNFRFKILDASIDSFANQKELESIFGTLSFENCGQMQFTSAVLVCSRFAGFTLGSATVWSGLLPGNVLVPHADFERYRKAPLALCLLIWRHECAEALACSSSPN